jgi:uncharacterized protein (DUF305 family)
MSSTTRATPTARRLRTGLAALALVLLPALAACGEESAEPEAVETAPGGEEFNQSDVDFATQMIPHHAQAMQMVVMAQGRDVRPEVADLMEQVRATHVPEVELMVDWLTAWGKEVPETSMDHGNAGHDADDMTSMEGMDTDLPGMMTGEELTDLQESSGEQFEQMWLSMMIEHHEGAVAMARDQVDAGHHQEAVELAQQVVEGRTAEIATMERLLD